MARIDKLEHKGREIDFREFYDKLPEEEHKYLENYIEELVVGRGGASFKADICMSLPQRLKENLQFRKKHMGLLYDLANKYTEYKMRTTDFLRNIGVGRHKSKQPFKLKDIPYINNRLTEGPVYLPDDMRNDLKRIKKKAISPMIHLASKDNVNMYCTWLMGMYKGQPVLFRCYEEVVATRDTINQANSGVSLEVFLKGRFDAGKYLTRRDFKPFGAHLNFLEDGEIAQYAMTPGEPTNFGSIQCYPDHEHIYSLETDLLMPRRQSVDAEPLKKQAKNYGEFRHDFFQTYNMDMTSMLEKDADQELPLAQITAEYFSKMHDSEQGMVR